jgi:quercetin dioxygenase-like cupin family protein
MMKVFPYHDVEATDADEGASKLKVRWLITKEIGAPNFAMRLFEMETGGNSPLHTHPWEHEVFILEGEGTVFGGREERALKAGDVVFVPPNEEHQFRSSNRKPLKFLCLVPHRQK